MLTESSAPTPLCISLYSSERRENMTIKLPLLSAATRAFVCRMLFLALTYRLIGSQDPLPIGNDALSDI